MTEGLAASDDSACGWSLVMDRQAVLPYDHFPDPGDARRILALGLVRGAPERTSVLVELLLGGAVLPATPRVLYSAPPGETLTTVEIARAAPGRTYATLVTPSEPPPRARLAPTTRAAPGP